MHHRLSLLSDLLLPLHLWYSHAVALTGAFSQESEPREVKAKPDHHPPKAIAPPSEGSSVGVLKMAFGAVMRCWVTVSAFPTIVTLLPSPIFYELGIKTLQ